MPDFFFAQHLHGNCSCIIDFFEQRLALPQPAFWASKSFWFCGFLIVFFLPFESRRTKLQTDTFHALQSHWFKANQEKFKSDVRSEFFKLSFWDFETAIKFSWDYYESLKSNKKLPHHLPTSPKLSFQVWRKCYSSFFSSLIFWSYYTFKTPRWRFCACT